MKKFARLGSALVCCVLLISLTAQAQQSKASPYDGMSAIDIRVAAALHQRAEESTGPTPALESAAGAISDLNFLSCDLVEVKGRDLHEGEFPIPGDPLPGQATALVEFNGFATTAQFRLLDETEALLENIELSPPPGQTASSSYLGTFTVPSQPFRIAANGWDLEDQAFDAVCDRLYSPQTVEVRFDVESNIVSAGLNEITGVVINHGAPKRFLISASSDLGIAVNTDITEADVQQGESTPFSVSLIVPDISSGVLDIIITAFATAETDPNLSNKASSLLRIERFENLFWDNFE